MQPGEKTGQHGAQTPEPRAGAPAGRRGTGACCGLLLSPQDVSPSVLAQVIARSWQRSESDERSQVESWRRVVEDKSKELESCRQELDSILDLVRCLQREILPVPKELR